MEMIATKIFHASPKVEFVVMSITAAVLFWLGRNFNTDDDVKEKGPHTFFSVSLELWGVVLFGLALLEFKGAFRA
jgi:hypothetical protein